VKEDFPFFHATAWEHEAGMHSHAGAYERERHGVSLKIVNNK